MSSRTLVAHGRRALLLAAILIVGGFELYVAWQALHPEVDADYRAYYIDQSTTCLNKPVSGKYQLGSTVSFLPDNQAGARQLRVCGWDGPAGDGTHSVGTTSRLRFGGLEPTNGLVLRLYLTAITAPDHPAQRLEFTTADGTSLGEAVVPADVTQNVDIAIPEATIDQGTGLLDVIISYPDAAEMTPSDSDTHYRAIKLMSVQLRRPGDAPSAGPQDDPLAQRHHAGP